MQRPARTVWVGPVIAVHMTKAEVNALPERTVIQDRYGDVLQLRGGVWCGYETAPLEPDWVYRKLQPITILRPVGFLAQRRGQTTRLIGELRSRAQSYRDSGARFWFKQAAAALEDITARSALSTEPKVAALGVIEKSFNEMNAEEQRDLFSELGTGLIEASKVFPDGVAITAEEATLAATALIGHVGMYDSGVIDAGEQAENEFGRLRTEVRAILAYPDGGPELGGEWNEWADSARIDLIRAAVNGKAPE